MKRILKGIAMTAIAAGLICSFAATPYTYVYADEAVASYDKTAIEDDLKSVDLLQYPANEEGTHRLLDEIGFTEFAYSSKATVSKYYGIYFYVYNPTGRELLSLRGAHVVNMAVKYDSKGEPAAYENTELKLLDETDDHRILKFGLRDQQKAYERARAYADRHGGVRRYDVAGVQLWFKGDENATDANTDRDETSYTYLCTGYAKGCAEESAEESTLDVERRELKTLTLDVHHTYYRPDQQNGKGIFTYDSLNSIYFSVPNEVIEKYGEMSGIKGQYLRARTNDIFVTGNEEIYNHLRPYVGKDVGYQQDGIEDDNKVMLCANAGYAWGTGMATNWTYNTSESFADIVRNKEDGRYFSKLSYLFYAKSGDAATYNVSTDALIEWMQNYTKQHKANADKLVGGKYHPDLFSEADENVTVFDISAGDKTDGFQTVKIDKSWWWQFYGKTNVTTQSTYYEGKEAIYRVKDEDLVYNSGSADLNVQATGDGLYIAQADVQEFADFYEENKEENYVYKIAFAVDDYVSAETRQGYWGGVIPNEVGDRYELPSVGQTPSEIKDMNAYLALEWVYLNFEIIETRFNLNGKETVIPVVMSPIDIIPDVTPPPDMAVKKNMRLVWWLVGITAGVLVVGVATGVIKKYAVDGRR